MVKRLVSLIATSATLEAEREAAMKQAQSASRAAETLMSSNDDAGKSSGREKELEKKVKAAEEGSFRLNWFHSPST